MTARNLVGFPFEVVREHRDGAWHHGYRGTCGASGRQETIWSRSNLPPEIVVKKFTERGWRADLHSARLWRAPEEKRTRKTMSPKPDLRAVANGPTIASAADAQAAAPSPKLTREIILVLGEHFNDHVGRWDDGWNDERVAKECDCAVAFVTKVRLEFFGPEQAPAELTKLRDDLGVVRQLLDDLHARVDTALKRYR
jgi:hypothetical protein